MTNSASVPFLTSTFDAFLFAQIGDDSVGKELSVVSALARQDLDPWEEAALLADLPSDQAVERLSSLISTLPGRSSNIRESQLIAGRLAALLPRSSIAKARSVAKPTGSGAATSPELVASMAFAALMLALLVDSQFLASGTQPVVQTSPAHTATSTGVSPRIPYQHRVQ